MPSGNQKYYIARVEEMLLSETCEDSIDELALDLQWLRTKTVLAERSQALPHFGKRSSLISKEIAVEKPAIQHSHNLPLKVEESPTASPPQPLTSERTTRKGGRKKC